MRFLGRFNLFTRTLAAFLLVAMLVGSAYIVMSSAFQHDLPVVIWQRLPSTLRLCAGEASHQSPAEFEVFLRRAHSATGLVFETYPQEKIPLNTIVEDRLHLRMTTGIQFATGERQELVGYIRRPTYINLFTLFLRWLFTIILVSLVCYWLARTVSAPILALRGAAYQVASGDFTVRVSQSPLFFARRDEIRDLARDFDTMVAQLQAGREAQQQLLADISHEMRSPLARLRVALELARRKSSPDALASIERIERETERMNSLLTELLALTHLEAISNTLCMPPLNLVALVQNIANDANFEASTRGCNVLVHTPTAELTIYGESELLHRAIENVVRNALRYTKAGTAVEITLTQEGDAILLHVRDHGPGVPEDVLKQIFEPFWRIGTDRDRASGGVGLGLAITERAIRLHGGQIQASNQEQGGLCITIILPQNHNLWYHSKK
jgi:signal transduction histidine kinase